MGVSKGFMDELVIERSRLSERLDAVSKLISVYGNGDTASAPAPAGVKIVQEATVPTKPRTKRAAAKPAAKRTSKPKDASSSGRRPRMSEDDMREKVIDAVVNGGLPLDNAEGYSISDLTEGLNVNRPAVVKALDTLKTEGLIRETTGKGKGWRFLPTGQAPSTPVEAPESPQEAPASEGGFTPPADEVVPPEAVQNDPLLDEPDEDAVEIEGDEEGDKANMFGA
jgi:hypothetical protein